MSHYHYLNVLERHEDISSSKNYLQSAPSHHNVSIGNFEWREQIVTMLGVQ